VTELLAKLNFTDQLAIMPHINLPAGFPGITGPLRAYPETARHLNGLAEALLRAPSSLTPAERELIAARVSAVNECHFCTQSHAAAARELYGNESAVVDLVLRDEASDTLSEKMLVLLTIAEKVSRDGRLVTSQDVEQARLAGADDRAIHDTVLIAAAFCMFNRYVDGLATFAPPEPDDYKDAGKRLATEGYLTSIYER